MSDHIGGVVVLPPSLMTNLCRRNNDISWPQSLVIIDLPIHDGQCRNISGTQCIFPTVWSMARMTREDEKMERRATVSTFPLCFF